MTCLLAPVPVIHLSSAMEVYKRANRVAFATSLPDFFDAVPEKVGLGMAVYLLASQTGMSVGVVPPLKVGHIQLKGRFAGYTRATATGFHPDPACRPLSTATDSPVLGFYEVEDLEIIAAIPLSKFLTASGKNHSAPLRRPVLAKLNASTSQ